MPERLSRQGGFSGGGGQNTFFGTGTTTFVDETARDAYFTANPLQLTQYENFEFLLIQVDTGFQRRSASAWIDVTTVVTGPKGEKGDAATARVQKGLHVATLAIPEGDYVNGQPLGGWVLEAGATGMGKEPFPQDVSSLLTADVPDAHLTYSSERITDTQQGWFIEVLSGTTVIGVSYQSFGGFSGFAIAVVTSNAGLALSYFHGEDGGYGTSVFAPNFTFYIFKDVTVLPTDEFSVKMYVSEV